MIPVELLKKVTKVITHESCPDGLATAILLHDALPYAEVVFVNYGRKEREEMPATPGQLWCDMTPPEGRAQEFVDAGAIVLDHHKGAEDLVRKFGDRGVFADEKLEPGVSGAVLAFREVWAPLRTERVSVTVSHVNDFATLAGIRDTWQKDSPRWREALVAYHALMLHPWEHWRDQEPWLDADDLAVGQALLTKRERDVESTAKKARTWTTSTGLRAAAVNCEAQLVSDTGDLLRERGVDVFLGFQVIWQEDRQVTQVSVRTSERFDAAAFCKRFGGGGHSRAAGFRKGRASFSGLERRLEDYLKSLTKAEEAK